LGGGGGGGAKALLYRRIHRNFYHTTRCNMPMSFALRWKGAINLFSFHHRACNDFSLVCETFLNLFEIVLYAQLFCIFHLRLKISTEKPDSHAKSEKCQKRKSNFPIILIYLETFPKLLILTLCACH